MGSHLDALQADPARADRSALLDRLVGSPEPLRGTLLRRWLSTCEEGFRRVLLEVYARRYYRIRVLRELSCGTWMGHLLCAAEYDLDGRRIHLVIGYAPLAQLPALSAAIAARLVSTGPDGNGPPGSAPVAGFEPDREIVVDVTAWHDGEGSGGDALVAELADLLRGCDFGRPLRRLDITVAVTPGRIGVGRARHVTFRQAADATFVEERLYRDMHPMLAKRLALWRLANFELERLPSAEDVYLFHGVARDNPADHRLFALAEVRDLTPVPASADTRGIEAPVTYPRLELMGMRALSAMRLALTRFGERDKPAANRIVLDVRPLWTLSPQVGPA